MSQAAPSPRPQPDIRVGSATNALEPVSSAERSLAAGRAQWLALLAVAVTAIVADQVTKRSIAGTLALGDEWQVPGPFSIHHVRNTGIAFGLFSGATAAVVAVTGVAVLAMVILFARSGQRHPLLPVAFGLVLGGSVSNFVDRARLGYVTDFLDLSYWPAFNLADVFICIGVGLLFVSFVASDRSSARVGRLPLSRS